MTVRFEYLGEESVLFVPTDIPFRFYTKEFSQENGVEFFDFNVVFWSKDTGDINIAYLQFLMEDYNIDSVSLSKFCNHLIDDISLRIQNHQTIIDINEIWRTVLLRDFKQEWLEKGYDKIEELV